MSDQSQSPGNGDPLHLNRFAPGDTNTPEPDPGLTVMVKAAAAQTVAKDGAPVLPRNAGALPAQDMLGAVSYCYAKGVYESEEIEKKMMQDPTLREAVQGEVPDAKAIRRFRALNRGAIRETLEKAFGLLRRKEKAALMKPLPGQNVVVMPPSSSADGSTVIFARKQAEERVDQAAFVDNMSKE
jgi:hypothetical protein